MNLFTEQDILHAIWMLDNQINDCGDLIHFWVLYGSNKQRDLPSIECCYQLWYHNLGIDPTPKGRKNQQ